ncbi:SHOCT domain-containing protein [bacterium]|nr:SHOCT domain-containing protein [bacterium]
MIRSDDTPQRANRIRNMLWGALGGMACCTAMMAIMMAGGHKLMGKICGKMKGMMSCGMPDALGILKCRYAEGEITKEEYQHIKHELEK